MFPNAEFLSIDLYSWMILLGIVVAMVFFRIFCDKMQVSSKVFNFALAACVCCIAVGYLFAVLFQSWYHYLDTGVWQIGVGATFYGGLIGAVIVFAVVYFGVGHFLFRNKQHVVDLDKILASGFPCVVVAHAFGRIGCLFAGCCYGKLTDGALGIEMWVNGEWQRRLPTQLFEAIFLFALFGVLAWMIFAKRSKYTPSVYLVSYGVWRFAIEFVRDDAERGSSGISWLTPSQLTALIMVVLGVAAVFVYKKFWNVWIEKVVASYETKAEK